MTPLPTAEHFDSQPDIGDSDTSLRKQAHVYSITAASKEHETDGRSLIAVPKFETITRGAPTCGLAACKAVLYSLFIIR
jgi:hypothetical protein